MTLKRALLAATALLLPAAVQAQPISGIYIGAGAGLNWLQKTDEALGGQAGADARAAGLPDRGILRWDRGGVGLVALGYGFGNGLRIELEGSYRSNNADDTTVAGLTSRSNGGRLYQWAAMANLAYDITIPGVPLVPYLGGGLGYTHATIDGGFADFRPGRSQILRADDEDGAFAFQAFAGAGYTVLPGLTLTAEYRFFGSTDLTFSGTQTQTLTGVTRRLERSQENYNHSVLIGLRYAFGAVPAPVVVTPTPAPAVAPTVARTFLVFFDFDRADLTDRARQIIGEAAQASRTTQTTRIEVSGHADRSGTPQYNQRLSERRAQAVAAELERQGVPRAAMVIQAFGESRPLVPTADGVREPQNRRVEIILR